MQDFRRLRVWSKAHRLTLRAYQVTRQMPSDERYELSRQLRTAASSIPSNLAEGCGRGSDADFRRFVLIANGSASELEYHLLLARDLGYISKDEHTPLRSLTIEVKRMLTALANKIGASG